MEVLIAITVLLIALVGPLTIAYSGLKRASLAKEQTMAIFLGQESTESVVKLREDNALNAAALNDLGQIWTNTFSSLGNLCPIGSNNYCGVTVRDDGSLGIGSFYTCSGSNCLMKYQPTARVPYKQGSVTGEDTLYTRRMQITVNGNEFARVISTVSWGERDSQRVDLETYVYNTYYEP